MNTEEEIQKLIEANPGVDVEKVREAVEKSRAGGGIKPRGYHLASPLDRHRNRVRVKNPEKPTRLRGR